MSSPLDVLNALYAEFLQRGIRYFFPACRLQAVETVEPSRPVMQFDHRADGTLHLDWVGVRYVLNGGRAFTENEIRLLGAVGNMLSARYRSIFQAQSSLATAHLFRGVPEDRYVSAFLDHSPYVDDSVIPVHPDVIAEAIEVLRESSLLTYENRRISTGALLYGPGIDPFHDEPEAPPGALPYASDLLAIKSFHRLCDGLQTVFLVNRAGRLVDLVDVGEWVRPFEDQKLPAPSAARYRGHCRATLVGGHICLVLTPNGEIKIFAEGAQVFSFLEGRWRLTDAAEKYRVWRRALGDAALAERVFTAALNAAENRRGGLYVLLDDAASVNDLVAPGDLLQPCLPLSHGEGVARGKDAIHYLLGEKQVLRLEPSILQSIARMDGSIVMDRNGRLLAFGAILRTPAGTAEATEGGRTTAAIAASQYGSALKISEDGMVSFYRDGRCVWEI